MAVDCGSQIVLCDVPIRFDTYVGCSHACKYCFVKKKTDITEIKKDNCIDSLKKFIKGERTQVTRWCDWEIPIHWGGMSDPFQPCEKKYRISYQALQVFAQTKYPFIVSTKNPVMLTEEPYLSLIQQCRCVLQISMACSKYDKLETGAPPFEERLKAATFLSDKVTRIIARVRPYFPDCHKDIMKAIPEYAQAGIYGISISGFVSKKKQKGMTRYGNNYAFSNEILAPKFREIKQACKDNGLKFFCCEDGLEHWSDSLTCCGTMGLDDFIPNKYNISHLSYDEIPPEPTEAMKAKDTYQPFKCIGQSQAWALKCKYKSFADLMIECGGYRIEPNRENLKNWKE